MSGNYQHFICLSVSCIALISGCGKPLPPRPSLAIEPGLTSRVQLTINGADPLTSAVSLGHGTEIEVQASYERPSNHPATWGRTVLYFVPVDLQRRVPVEMGLGEASEEKRQGKKTVWECHWRGLQRGRKIKLMYPAGEYDVIMCWQRDRVSVADETAYQECPLNLATPIYQARVTIVDPEVK